MSSLKETQEKVEKQNVNPVKPVMLYEVDEFNSVQNKMYKEAIFGFTNFTTEEIKTLSFKDKNKINKIHRKAQGVLNIWKQELCTQYTNKLLGTFFPKSFITKELKELNIVDANFKNFINFKSLGISKKDIIIKLIKHEVLPENFFELT